jgi:hypothetical protein
MMKMKWSEVIFWYENYELQITEEEVVQELQYDSKGNKKKLPSQETIRTIVNERIEERRIKNGRSKPILDECSDITD